MDRTIINTLIVFLLSGIWHGANWTFLWWGLINGLLFIPLIITNNSKVNLGVVAAGKWLPNLKEIVQMIITFTMVCFAWVFFRAENLQHALGYLNSIVANTIVPMEWKYFDKITFFAIFILLVVDWISRENGFDSFISSLRPAWQRRLVYSVLFGCIFFLGVFSRNSFIYFQF